MFWQRTTWKYPNCVHIEQVLVLHVRLCCLTLCHCSAGIGVLNAARKTMARMLGNNESAFESARSQFWVVDAKVSYFIS